MSSLVIYLKSTFTGDLGYDATSTIKDGTLLCQSKSSGLGVRLQAIQYQFRTTLHLQIVQPDSITSPHNLVSAQVPDE